MSGQYCIRLRIQLQIRLRILPSCNYSKKNLDFYVLFCDFLKTTYLSLKNDVNVSVFRIRIGRIHMFFDLPDSHPTNPILVFLLSRASYGLA
jgi:hypothetical protein